LIASHKDHVKISTSLIDGYTKSTRSDSHQGPHEYEHKYQRSQRVLSLPLIRPRLSMSERIGGAQRAALLLPAPPPPKDTEHLEFL
jgi:hypothetical protein